MALQRLPQRNLHQFICERWHPPECLFYKSENGCRFVENALVHTARFMNSLAKGFKNNGDRSALAMLKQSEQHDHTEFPLCAIHQLHDSSVCQGMVPPKFPSIFGRAQTIGNRSDVFSSQKPSYVMLTIETKTLEWFAQGDPHQRNPNAPIFEDRPEDETEWQERCALETTTSEWNWSPCWGSTKNSGRFWVRSNTVWTKPCVFDIILKLDCFFFVGALRVLSLYV